MNVFLWVVLPYLAIGVFVVGHVWRWRHDQFGWTSRSTQLQERRLLKWGSPAFHYGTFAAIAGHVIGVLIPESWTRAVGLPEYAYRWFSAGAGTLAAVLVIGGVVILAGRRLLVPRVRATTSRVDYVALVLLLVIIVTGVVPTLFVNLLGPGYDYRTSVAPWFRGLFVFHPDVTAIAAAPIVYKVHAASAWLIWALWPFSRLVHAWSAPLWYLWRPYVVYRSRRPARPAEPGTAGRRWRKISVLRARDGKIAALIHRSRDRGNWHFIGECQCRNISFILLLHESPYMGGRENGKFPGRSGQMIHVAGPTDLLWTVSVGMGFAVIAVVIILLNLLLKSVRALDSRVDEVWSTAVGVFAHTVTVAPQLRKAEQTVGGLISAIKAGPAAPAAPGAAAPASTSSAPTRPPAFRPPPGRRW